MTKEILIAADQRAGAVHLWDPALETFTARLDGPVLAEHAGVLQLPGGRCAFVDDAGGELLVLDPFRPASPVLHRISVAIPGEHVSSDPAGRFVAVTTGLGMAWTAWSDLLTVVDLEADGGPRSRRIRTRAGEPGVVVANGPNGHHAVLRHREPGAVESVPVDRILAEGIHCPELRGDQTDSVSGNGHGDAYDPVTGIMFVATDRGLERFDVSAAQPTALDPLAWEAPGRAYFIRFCPRRRLLVGVLRAGGDEPRRWHLWPNAVWVHELDSGRTRTAPLGPGLIFRFALTRTGLAVTRVHPDGDDLTVLDLDTLAPRGVWALPAMDKPPRAGAEPWDNAERRAVAASPSSEWVAVSRGGHGQIHLLDSSSPHHTLQTVHPGTPMHEGGHLTWLSSESAFAAEAVGR